MNATESAVGEFPAYARERLQTKVRKTLGAGQAATRIEEAQRGWLWRLWLSLATVTVVIVTLMIPFLVKPPAPTIQVAMLDVAGQTRGGATSDLAVLQAAWPSHIVQNFSTASELQSWEVTWPTSRQPAAKIVLDRSTAEIRVVGKSKDKTFQKSFSIENGLDAALRQAKAFVVEQTGQLVR